MGQMIVRFMLGLIYMAKGEVAIERQGFKVIWGLGH